MEKHSDNRAAAGRIAGKHETGRECHELCVSGPVHAVSDTQASKRSPNIMADTEKYFVSEASVYRILKSYDLITSPAYVVLSASDEFREKTTRPNQLWLTDFTCLKVIGWGWFYLSTILDDYSRYIIA